MDDSLTMRFVESIRNLDAVAKGLLQRQCTFLQAVGERLAFDVLHDEELDTVFFAYVMEGTNVWVVQARDSAGFALEALSQLRVGGEVARQHFDRNGSLETAVSRLVDLSHAPAPIGERIS